MSPSDKFYLRAAVVLGLVLVDHVYMDNFWTGLCQVVLAGFAAYVMTRWERPL